MNYYPFNSQKSLYKSKIGAVAESENLTLRLLLHKDARCHDAFLIVIPDGANPYEIHLEPKEYIEDYQFFDCTVGFDAGLYWYYFRYTSDYGEFFVTKTETSLGIVSKDGEKWQQTVYKNGFSTPEWLEGGIIYQIFPDRFFASGSQKENVPQDRFIQTDKSALPEHRPNCNEKSLGNDYFCGDLKGIEEKLDYIADLGVNCIYLNPIFEAHSNHRYNTADYTKIDSLLGSEKDLISLCNTAKEKGIHIILDGVFSHTGDDSIYFNKHHRYGDGGAYNDTNSKYRSWYDFGNFDCGYSAWWGVPSLPQVDENNPEFTEFITGKNGVIRHWLKCGVSGFRLDVADELPDEFLCAVRKAIKEENPQAYLLGEVWEDASNKISYSKRRRFLQGEQLDSVMNYPFANGIIDFVCEGNAQKLDILIKKILENYPECSSNVLMNHVGTHDTARILTELARHKQYCGDRDWQSVQKLSEEEYNEAVRKLKLVAVIQYTVNGVPSLYYGDEVGMQGYGDPFCRGYYNWDNGNKDLLEFYKSLGKTRRNCNAFKKGKYESIKAEDKFFAFIRQDKNDIAIIAVNAGYEQNTIALPKLKGKANIFGKQPSGDSLTLEPYEYSIITGRT